MKIEIATEVIEVMVQYKRADHFVEKVKVETDCTIISVREWLSNELLQYVIECPLLKKDYITELAFMSFISNPKFQKYYDK
jgi:hypothetical protein